MEKIKERKPIFYTTKDMPFTWKEIKHVAFEDDDEVIVEWVEPCNLSDGHWHVLVSRMIEETDEELQKRIQIGEKNAKWLKEKRYESYLRLKKEFENE
jgi:hypothetical protein